MSVAPERGIPVWRRRSAVFSSRRSTTDLGRAAPTVEALAAAVAAVLVRTWGRGVTIGLGRMRPGVSSVEADGGDTIGEIRRWAAAQIGQTCPCEPPASARNPDFDVSVLAEVPTEDHREDVVVTPFAGGVRATWRARLLDADAVRRFLDQVSVLLDAGDERLLGSLPWMGEAEEARVRGFESGADQVGSRTPVHLQVLDRCREQPEQLALETVTEVLEYGELDRRSAAVAAALVERGVGPGHAIGLSVSEASGVTVLLGILRTGAAAVPLDATFPRARLQSQLDQAEVTVVVVDETTRDRVPARAPLVLEDVPPTTERPRVDVPSEGTAYVMFTSGSTGVPKGVRMSHRALSNLVAWQRGRGAAKPRTLQRTSLAFDVAMQEVFCTLCAGGCLVVADGDVRADPSRLPDFIAARRIERVFVPPVSLAEMAAAFDARPQPLPSLREVYVAGEALRIDASVIRMFRAVGATLENHYGPTETHVATTHRLDDSPLRWPHAPPIGRPVPGLEVRILDDQGRRVPIGVPGEIVVRGVQVADGYLWGAAFLAEDGVPAYATGDLGRWTPTGDIEFLGRRDRQVKVRGYRIEPGEVETALLALPGVRGAVVDALEDGGSRRLVAWIQAGAGFFGMAESRQRLLGVLPEHMVPAMSAMMMIDGFPLTRTGKIDRAALPAPGSDRPDLRADYVPSRNQTEAILSDIWRQELGLERVGVDDDFLEIGGHSLLAIRIVSRINERLGVSLPLRVLLQGGTIAGIAKRLHGAAEPPPEALGRLRLPDGRTVLTPFAPETEYLWHDVFELDTYGAPLDYPEDAVVIDVGANIGLYALYVLERAQRGRVVAVEPVPRIVEALRGNLAEHGDRISLFACAAGDRDGTAEVTSYPRLTGMSSLAPDRDADAKLLRTIVGNLMAARGDLTLSQVEIEQVVDERLTGASTVVCPVRRLESILDEAAPTRIDVLKIDVQRYEESVLAGVGAAWSRVRQVVVEVHDQCGALERVQSLLSAHGYDVTTRQVHIHVGTCVHFVAGRR